MTSHRAARLIALVCILLACNYCHSFYIHRTHPTTRTSRLITPSLLHAKKKAPKRKSQAGATISVNRVAYRNYEIIDTIEAGISLKGTEIKAIRDGRLNLRDGYVRPSFTTCTLFNVHIGKCGQASSKNDFFQHEERRPRQLLVHKAQSRKWKHQVEQQGLTVVPLKAYFNAQNRLKLEIALVRGKNVRDKRATIRERDMKRETSRMIKNFGV